MDGLAAVQARIAAIETRFTTRPPVTTPTASTSEASFDDLLRDELVIGVEPTADLSAYGNGRIPTEALTPIGTGSHRLDAGAAEAFSALQAAARAEGVTIGITDSYRSYDDQVRLAEEKGLYSQGGLAAVPGTSDHGWGRALDLDLDDRALAWMRTNATRFGFVEDTPREPWHWTFEEV